jgi:hypothetical protein
MCRSKGKGHWFYYRSSSEVHHMIFYDDCYNSIHFSKSQYETIPYPPFDHFLI